MTSKNLYRVCPVCECTTGNIIHNQTFVKMFNSPLPENYDLVNCSNCGFVFADTSANQVDYNDYYSALSKYEDGNISSGSGFDQNDYDRLVRTAISIEKHVNFSSPILDLGCANGGQLRVLKERGFLNLFGVDPSKVCVQNVKKAEIDAFQAHLFEESFINLDKKFDLIIVSHVLEHIRDLKKAIQILKNKLTDSGLIYIEVPDASRYHKFFVVPYYYIDCEHINHFSLNSLKNLMGELGFNRIESFQGQIKLNEQIDYPYIYSFFNFDPDLECQISFDDSVINSFDLFLKQSEEKSATDLIIKKIVESQEEVVIWGAGQFALRLLANSELDKANILGFIDTDKSKQDKTIGRFKIHFPDFLKNLKCTLLICSALYANDIKKSALQIYPSLIYYVLK